MKLEELLKLMNPLAKITFEVHFPDDDGNSWHEKTFDSLDDFRASNLICDDVLERDVRGAECYLNEYTDLEHRPGHIHIAGSIEQVIALDYSECLLHPFIKWKKINGEEPRQCQ